MADLPDQQLLVQVPVIRVARMPVQYTITQPLDFNQRNDITIFKNGCAALEGDRYDGTKLKTFFD
jgi:hypothetical protein